MNILYLSIPGGGLDTSVRVAAPALTRAGHSVSILYLRFAGDSLVIPPLNDLQVYQARIGDLHYKFSRLFYGAKRSVMILRALETAWTLRRTLERIARIEPFDLVELPEGFGWGRLMRKVPYVMRLHSSAWMCREMFCEPALPSDPWERAAEAEMLRGARGVSSPSIFVADHIRNVCAVRDPITVIPYPIDTDRFAPATERGEPKTILFVGRIEKRKGADVLLRAIPLVHAKFPECKFVFAGRVSEELVQSLPPDAREGEGGVSILGGVPYERLIPWYRRANLFVAPSLWDNSPNTIYEAMACGTPVIATRVGGIPELVEDCDTGLLVPPRDEFALANAIIELLVDPARRERMGRSAREKAVRMYSVENIIGLTLDFYDRSLASDAH